MSARCGSALLGIERLRQGAQVSREGPAADRIGRLFAVVQDREREPELARGHAQAAARPRGEPDDVSDIGPAPLGTLAAKRERGGTMPVLQDGHPSAPHAAHLWPAASSRGISSALQ